MTGTDPKAASSLGAFSVSLTVADLAESIAFYRKLGFERTGGEGDAWAILVNGQTVLGLFHGMFDRNILTFNPGWGVLGAELDEFTDVRELRDRFVDAGIDVTDDTTQVSDTGPASFVIVDPDGNPILFDQHR